QEIGELMKRAVEAKLSGSVAPEERAGEVRSRLPRAIRLDEFTDDALQMFVKLTRFKVSVR
ncbi:MAG: hypothetical protein ACREFP_20370, partial [Acetobacteraceae bacterium]